MSVRFAPQAPSVPVAESGFRRLAVNQSTWVRIPPVTPCYREVAQLAEQRPLEPQVVGSLPTLPAIPPCRVYRLATVLLLQSRSVRFDSSTRHHFRGCNSIGREHDF